MSRALDKPDDKRFFSILEKKTAINHFQLLNNGNMFQFQKCREIYGSKFINILLHIISSEHMVN